METNIEILNIQDGAQPTRVYDFEIDQDTAIGKIFIDVKDKNLHDIQNIFKEKLESKEYGVEMYLSWMITAYREHGKLRLFCGDITQLCYGEVIKEWLNNEILKLSCLCGIFLTQ